MLGFYARILKKELTLRMHYTNCNGFNADFDGDEMNLHVLQEMGARHEGIDLMLSDKHFINSTS